MILVELSGNLSQHAVATFLCYCYCYCYAGSPAATGSISSHVCNAFSIVNMSCVLSGKTSSSYASWSKADWEMISRLTDTMKARLVHDAQDGVDTYWYSVCGGGVRTQVIAAATDEMAKPSGDVRYQPY